MIHRITKIIAVAAMALGLLIAGLAAPANAITGPFGGKVILKSNSTGNLKVSGGLARTSNGNYVMRTPIGWIAPGQNSRTHAHIYDADAFQAPWGCSTTMSFGSGKTMSVRAGMVKKIGDFSTTTVTVKC